MSAVTARRRARELVLQGLYERQVGRSADDAIAAGLTESPGHAKADPDYFRQLWNGVCGEYDTLLQDVEPNVDRKIKDVAPIERGLLAIGAWELTHRLDIPYRVVIDEAVELAKAYGGTDGHKFVNGVLDKLVPRLRAAEVRGPSRDE
ncbi:MAG TPA: transcription antitermination factor NusB [Casimicrobiaceae bacterium]|nr:transcription antitermination factor NusB [Casimicrobiaceae bacterium]